MPSLAGESFSARHMRMTKRLYRQLWRSCITAYAEDFVPDAYLSDVYPWFEHADLFLKKLETTLLAATPVDKVVFLRHLYAIIRLGGVLPSTQADLLYKATQDVYSQAPMALDKLNEFVGFLFYVENQIAQNGVLFTYVKEAMEERHYREGFKYIGAFLREQEKRDATSPDTPLL